MTILKNPTSDTGVDKKSESLNGVKLFYGVCGSIGAVEAVRQIRELRRHGASVFAVMTPASKQFITPLSLQWASQNPVLEELSASSEHLEPMHAMIICPASWNTLVALKAGFCPNALTTIAALQISKKNPMLIVPTLHAEFMQHPQFNSTLEELNSYHGVQIIHGPFEEGRYKMPQPEQLAKNFIEVFNSRVS